MPRDRGGKGRTGNKHKKVAKFDVHRRAKDAENVVNADTSRDQGSVPKTDATITSGALTAQFEQLHWQAQKISPSLRVTAAFSELKHTSPQPLLVDRDLQYRALITPCVSSCVQIALPAMLEVPTTRRWSKRSRSWRSRSRQRLLRPEAQRRVRTSFTARRRRGVPATRRSATRGRGGRLWTRRRTGGMTSCPRPRTSISMRCWR